MLTTLMTVLVACAATTAPKPPAPSPPPAPIVGLSPEVDAVLDRLVGQFAGLPGVQVKAAHRIEAPSDTVLHRMVRDITIIKPNKIHLTQDGVPMLVSDGTTAWTVPTKGTVYVEHAAPPTLGGCIKQFPQLGNGGIASSAGLVAALLSEDPKKSLLQHVDAISTMPKGSDDLIVMRIGEGSARLRPGLRLGIFVPQTGKAWPVQMDVIPPNAEVFTRIAFSDWAPTNGAGVSFDKPEAPDDRGVFVPSGAQSPGSDQRPESKGPSSPN